jgi:hypothetical protein
MADSHPITLCRGKLLYVCHIAQATIFVIFLEMLAARVYKCVCLFDHRLRPQYDTALTDR